MVFSEKGKDLRFVGLNCLKSCKHYREYCESNKAQNEHNKSRGKGALNEYRACHKKRDADNTAKNDPDKSKNSVCGFKLFSGYFF